MVPQHGRCSGLLGVLTCACLSLPAPSLAATHQLYVGGPGWALQFDGVHNFAHILRQLPCPNATIELWAKPFSSSDAAGRTATKHRLHGTLLSRYLPKRLFTLTNDGRPTFTSMRDGSALEIFPADSSNMWHHWTLVVEGTHWTSYLDGVRRGTAELTSLEDRDSLCQSSLTAFPWVLGGRSTYPRSTGMQDDLLFGGHIDEIRWWSRALSVHEIRKWMILTPKEDEPGLFQRWGFDTRLNRNVDVDESTGVDETGFSIGAEQAKHTPSFVPSTLPQVGSPVVINVLANSAAVTERLCAALTPPTLDANVTASFTWPAGPVLGLLGPAQANVNEMFDGNFTMELPASPPWYYGGDTITTLYCAEVKFLPRVSGHALLPVSVIAELPRGGGRLEETGVLDIQVRPSLPPVAGRATALSLDGQGYASLGMWELPTSETNGSFSFSVWVDPYVVAEDTYILSRHTVSGEDVFLFGFLRGRYYIWMDCRGACNGGEANTEAEMLFPPAGQETLPSGKTAVEVLQERDQPHLLTVSVWCHSRGNADPINHPAASTVEMFVDGHSIGVVTVSTCWHAPLPGTHLRLAPWELGAEYDPGDYNTHAEGLSVQPSGFFHGLFDDLRFWERALTANEAWALAAGEDVQSEDLIVRYTFDQEPLDECQDRQLVNPNISCFLLGDIDGRTTGLSGGFTFANSLMGSGSFVPSSFFKLRGSTLHRTMPQGDCAEIQLQGADPNGAALSFSLPDAAAQLPVFLTGSTLRYCATDLGRLEVPFDACNGQGRCASETSGLGTAAFDVLRQGPGIRLMQWYDKAPGLTFRFYFTEKTNGPPISSMEAVHQMLHMETLAGWVLVEANWEWSRFRDGNVNGSQALRVRFEGLNGVRVGFMLVYRNNQSNGFFFQVKKAAMIRDNAETSFPSTASAATNVQLRCKHGETLEPSAPWCTLCPPGKVALPSDFRNGEKECNACDPGFHQPLPGTEECVRCPVGRFTNNTAQSACISCDDVLPGSTTRFQASTDRIACICKEGSALFRASPTEPAVCQACQKGLHCPGGRAELNESYHHMIVTVLNPQDYWIPQHQPPLQQAGFAAGLPLWADGPPAYVTRCQSIIACPEGLQLGQCPPLREGRACALCAPGAYVDGLECRPCDLQQNSIEMIYPVVLGLALLVMLYIVGTKRPAIFWKPSVTIAISFTVAFSAVQVLGSLAAMDNLWPEPMPSMKAWLSIFMLNLDRQRLSCIFSSYGPLSSYLGSLAIYPVAATVLSLVMLCSRLCPSRRVSMSTAINMHGTGLMSVFTSISVIALAPLKCRTNPDGSSTPEAYPSVVCWEGGDHLMMVIASILALLFIVLLFLAVLVWATLVYPYMIVQPGGGEHVVRFKFLFGAYVPHCYFFGLLLGLRKLFIALAPMVVVDLPPAQLLLVMLVIAGNMAVQCSLWPWRTYSGNLLDASTAMLLVMLISAGFLLGDFEPTQGQLVGARMVLSTLGSGVALLIGTIMYWGSRMAYSKRSYSIFLSHHKVGAGLLARWLKLLLRDMGLTRVFLDSDNLQQLDMLMNIVAHECENVVVLLTGETLSRPWCAMELAAAHKSGTRVVPVVCDGFGGISDEFLDSLPTLWSPDQQTTMVRGGISIADVRNAYEALRSNKAIALSRTGANVKRHIAVVKEILARCSGKEEGGGKEGGGGRSSIVVEHRSSAGKAMDATYSTLSATAGKVVTATSSALSSIPRKSFFKTAAKVMSAERPHSQSGNCKVAIVADMFTDESACACRVLQVMLQETMQESVAVKSMYEGLAAKCVLIVMRPGVLKELDIAESAVRASEDPEVELIPLIVSDFAEFPNAEFWNDLAAGDILSKNDLRRRGLSVSQVATAYKKLFNTLAMRLSGHGSTNIQLAEVQGMASRIKVILKSASVVPTTSAEEKMEESPSTPPEKATLPCLTAISDPTEAVHGAL